MRKHSEQPAPQWVEFAALIAARYEPPSTGRHSVIGDQEIIARILHYLAKGNARDTASELAGTTGVTFTSLMKRGEADESPFNAFLWAVKTAEGVAESGAIDLVLKAGSDPRFWTAPMTWLERKFPQKYARRQEDSNSPRVIVQIGAVDSDVKVLVQGGTTPSTDNSDLSLVPRNDLAAVNQG